MKNDFNFTTETTKYIKGIALLLMFASHLFTFPEWIVDGNEFVSIPFRSNSIAYFVGKFGGICVGIFMFLTGYGMFYSYQKGNCVSISIKRIIKFLSKYWILLFTFFLPIELLTGRTYYNPEKWFQELFGVYTSIVNFAWYVRFYVLAMLTLPILIHFLKGKSYNSLLFSIVPFQIISLILRFLSTKITFHNAEAITAEYFRYISLVLIGYCFAKFELFNKFDKLLSKYHTNTFWVCILGVFVTFVARVKLFSRTNLYMPEMDILCVPLFLFFTAKLLSTIKFKPILNGLEIIGNNSLNLWFLQSIFFFETEMLQWIIYWPKLSICVLLWNVIVLLPVSIFYNKIYKKLHII